MTRDETRTAGLLFGEELALGLVEPQALDVAEVQRAVRALPVPSPFSRRYQQRQLGRGRLSYQRHCVQPQMAARRAVLGDAAQGRPKFLVRVNAFPHVEAWDAPARYTTAQAREFHKILQGAGVPYLIAVTPRVPRRAMDPNVDEWREHDDEERELLAELRRDGVGFAVHGLDHRTRTANARRRSEFTGLKRRAVEERLDTAQAVLRDEALHADVFAPPFGRFDAPSWPALASRFDVVCGGPGSLASMGFHLTPSWRGDAVWLPSYPPLYGSAADVLPAVLALVDQQTPLWIPITLHWGQEQDDEFRALALLCAELGANELARSWEDFLLAVGVSRQSPSTTQR